MTLRTRACRLDLHVYTRASLLRALFPGSNRHPSPLRPLHILLSWLLCGLGALSAQSSFSTFETVELPLLGFSSDHGTLAMNDSGDIFAAWTRVDNQGNKHVDGVFLPRINTTRWELPDAADILVLGDSSLGLLDPVDRCFKPDVAAVGDNFIVAFPRIDPSSLDARLEISRIVVVPNVSATVDSWAPGQGYVFDNNVDAGRAGLMPDLTRIRKLGFETDLACVAYAHELSAKGIHAAYELRGGMLDFRSGGMPSFGGRQVLAANVHVDEAPITITGGRVLPDIVEDDHGNIIVAYEQYTMGSEQGAIPQKGEIVVKRFELVGSGQFSELETVVLRGARVGPPQRRPNLATTRKDATNTVSLTWMELFDPVHELSRTFHYELEFQGGASIGPVAVRDFRYPSLPGASDTRPVPIHGSDIRGAVAGHSYVGVPSEIYVSMLSPFNNFAEVGIDTIDPRRPAIDLWENFGVPGGLQLMPLLVESPPTAGATNYRLYLMVARL